MIYSLNEHFGYLECSNCGCLQLIDIPDDMGRYYPSDKYHQINKNPNIISQFFIKKRDEYALFSNSSIGKIIYQMYPNLYFEIIGKMELPTDSKIIDVGCGNGEILLSLKRAGFTNLVGIDPYIKKTNHMKDIKILIENLNNLSDEKFDLILFRHSFEHINEQLATLIKVKNLLSKKGCCLISMPIKTEYIWNKYGINWIQIDAPRHFHIHTIKSFRLLLNKVKLNLHDVAFNSTALQFWGSEQNMKNIPLKSPNSFDINPKNSIFTKKTMKIFENESKFLNKNSMGDQAIFSIQDSK